MQHSERDVDLVAVGYVCIYASYHSKLRLRLPAYRLKRSRALPTTTIQAAIASNYSRICTRLREYLLSLLETRCDQTWKIC
jgi:hypothetical protein